jgi:hypothetical protein
MLNKSGVNTEPIKKDLPAQEMKALDFIAKIFIKTILDDKDKNNNDHIDGPKNPA